MKYTIPFLRKIGYALLVSVVSIVASACSSESDPEPMPDPPVDMRMKWTANTELNTRLEKDNAQEHRIYFPAEGGMYEITCTNRSELNFCVTHILGGHVDNEGYPNSDEYWCHWEDGNPDFIATDKLHQNPYHKIEIKGNTIYVSLKSEMVTPKQCPLHFAIKGDNDKHRDLFWLIPESSVLHE